MKRKKHCQKAASFNLEKVLDQLQLNLGSKQINHSGVLGCQHPVVSTHGR
jgi:hypothetical protein